MLVVDASVLTSVVGDEGPAAVSLRARLASVSIAAPSHMRVEVTSALRGHEAAGRLPAEGGRAALRNLLALPVAEYPTSRLLVRAWELRHNLTPYDACYVALAEALGCPLLTADARLARAPGVTCDVELL